MACLSCAGAVSLFLLGYVVPRFAEVYQGAGRDLPWMSRVMLGWGQFASGHTSTLLAAYCCQLLEVAVEPEHPDPGLHDLLKRALDHLDITPPSLRALRHYESELARLLGVTHHQSPAEHSLREALGTLPASRGELLERLSSPSDFRSSVEGNRE